MAIFPADDVVYGAAQRQRLRPLVGGYSWIEVDYVKKTEAEAGKSLYRDVWGRTRGVGEMTFEGKNDDIAILWAFWFSNRLGQTFTFYDFDESYLTVTGAIDGSGTTTIPIGAREARAITVTVAGGGAAWTLLYDYGVDDEDAIQITGGVAAAAVTITFWGRKKYPKCEIPEPPTRSNIGWRRQRLQMKVRESFN